jgi:NAD(P)-dependent dehydrogenase (short-subunit alcohol dehydrogenase family)
MTMADWTFADIPDVTGKTMVVTGANSGLGLVCARELARRGAEVVLACRTATKGEDTRRAILADVPSARLRALPLELAELASVRSFARAVKAEYSRLDLLMNNAGVMNTPKARTADGFELQLGTNHLGHFALTCELLDLLIATPGSRVVTVSSSAHRAGSIDFDDLMFERKGYTPFKAYARSKLANLLFAYELQHRLERAGADSISVAAHPGASQTNLGRHFQDRPVFRLVNPLLGRIVQGPESGALSQLRAAVDPAVEGGAFYGPDGLAGMSGPPVRASSSKASRRLGDAERLWAESERLTETRSPV